MSQVIAHKDNLYNTKKFIEEVMKNSQYLDGVFLDVTLTKDSKVLIFSPVSSNREDLDTIQNNNLVEIDFLDIFLLKEALDIFASQNFKIILNLLPLNEIVAASSYHTLVKDYEHYLEVVIDLLKKYQHLNIFISSPSYNLLYILKRKTKAYKLGVVLDINNVSYIDVDFYIFSPIMLREDILLEQLERQKEIMIRIKDCDDMSKVIQFLEEEDKTGVIKEKSKFITNHPCLFLKLI